MCPPENHHVSWVIIEKLGHCPIVHAIFIHFRYVKLLEGTLEMFKNNHVMCSDEHCRSQHPLFSCRAPQGPGCSVIEDSPTHRLTNTQISATGPAEPSILFGPKIDQTDSPTLVFHWWSKMRIEIESACHPTWWAWEFESRDFLTVNIYIHPDFWSEIDVNLIRFLPSSCHWPFYHLKTGGQKGYPWESGLCGNPVYVIHSNMGVSENSVPLNPMVLLIIIPMKNGYFIGNIPYFQTNPYGHRWF